MNGQGIQVVVVDGSLSDREILVRILSADPDISVAQAASEGFEAVRVVKRCKPHVVVIDTNIPQTNGFEVTQRIMQVAPVPIILVSPSWNPQDRATSFRAIEAGALAILEKPRYLSLIDSRSEPLARELIETVKRVSDLRLVKRLTSIYGAVTPAPIPNPEPVSQPAAIPAPSLLESRTPVLELTNRIVGIGVSMGGPAVLQSILSKLPETFPLPILIVQHITLGFSEALARWLNQSSKMPVHVPAHGMEILPGNVYLAPGGSDMQVNRSSRIYLSPGNEESDLCPSVESLFRSLANTYGSRAIGIILTGIGKDGAKGLKLMKDKGAVTIAQDKETSAVHGMPGEAIRLGAATYILPPDRIVDKLIELMRSARIR